jgi:hypothetical protein
MCSTVIDVSLDRTFRPEDPHYLLEASRLRKNLRERRHHDRESLDRQEQVRSPTLATKRRKQ